MISAVDEIESVIRCVQLGAEDYLPKPFNSALLRARVGASLEKKALRDEVRDWNKKLEARVQDQVAQLGRLGRLKDFFSPQLAESIVSGGGEDLLKTHRREVVVVFLDLRGFTAFTDGSEPEEVMAVLGEYHRVMGQLIMAHEGTLERFAGDGLMIFFNDPIKLENPTANAVKMALEMQEKFAPLRAAWKKRGFDLDLAIGIAQGYATLGAIGFEGRWDYACIGSVTNLAARLCGDAKGGQILTNQKTLARIEEATQAEPLGEVTLKGIAQPVQAFNVTAFKS
jgi:class 3 adenylate cyclase